MRRPAALPGDSRSSARPLRRAANAGPSTPGGDHNGAVRSIVPLPPSVRAPFDVYVNGVHQEEGVDYELADGRLVFERELRKEGKLGFWRWFLGAWGVGTYRQNDSVDVRYEIDGRPALVEGLEIEPG
jgi:hypothetical protein